MVSISDLLEQHDKPQEPPPLTKAEKKKLKKQQKKLEKEAKMRKSQEDEMDREIKVAKKNILNFRTKWKGIQMEKGRPEYKEYMMEHWCLFDHLMDKKDKLIEVLDNELEMTERTRLTSFMHHAGTVERLLQDYNKELNDIRSEMFSSKCRKMCERDTNVKAFKNVESYVDENMRLVLYLLDLKKKEDYEIWGGEFVTKKDEEIMLNRSEQELLIARLEVKLTNLWKSYKDILEEYLDYSNKILKHSNVLMEKVKDDDKLISNQKSKIAKMLAMIESYKSKATSEPKGFELRDLRTERTQLYTIYTYEKKRLEEAGIKNYNRLSHLINCNNEVNTYLQNVKKKGKNILTMYEHCGKLETKKEHINKKHNTKYYKFHHPTANKMLIWWKRVSHASTIVRLMNVENRKLKSDNKFLKQQVAKVLQSSQLRDILRDVTKCSKELFKKKHRPFNNDFL